jgi:hypothetical protein
VRILRQSRIRAVKRHGVKGARTQIRSCGAFVLVDETTEDVAAEQPRGLGRCAGSGLRPFGRREPQAPMGSPEGCGNSDWTVTSHFGRARVLPLSATPSFFSRGSGLSVNGFWSDRRKS